MPFDHLCSNLMAHSREEQYQEGLKQWKKTCSDLCTILRDRIYNVLLFPGGGWLVDQYEVNDSLISYFPHYNENAFRLEMS